MVQGTSPAAPCPSLGRRGGAGIIAPYHPSFLGQDLEIRAGGLAQLAPLPAPPTQLLHKNNGAPAPGVGWRAGRGRDMAIGAAIPPPLPGVQKSPPFQCPSWRVRSGGGTRGSPPLRKRKCLCAHSAERRGGDVCQAQGLGSHFRRPLALRSPASRLGLPSSVEDVVGSVCPQRAISACSPTEAATASSQPFISSWREKQGTESGFGRRRAV